MPMSTGNWKNYTDSDGLKALKTDHLLTDKKAKKSISLDSRFQINGPKKLK